MSGPALLRRQCIRAKRTLMKRWPSQYSESRFEVARKGEYEELEGTPMYWTESHEGESDCRTAVEELRLMAFMIETDWERIARQDDIRYRNSRARAAIQIEVPE